MALTKVSTPAIKDEAVTLAKLLHGDSNSNGKFLRANNGADPSFETVSIPDADRIIEGNSYAEVLDTGSNGIFRFLPEGTEKFRIDTDGNVGIGTSFPTTPDNSNADNPLNGPLLTIYGDSPAINLISSTTGTSDYSLINFGRTGSSSNPYRAVIGYKQSDDILRINANNHIAFDTGGDINTNERMRINGSGNVGVNQPSPIVRFHVKGDSNGNGSVVLEPDSGKGSNISHIHYGATGDWYIRPASSSGYIRHDIGKSIFTNGILFGSDTAAANTLDDYEEGTYTPAPTDGTAQSSPTDGQYTKIGNFCIVTGSINLSGDGTSSAMVGFSLPFTAGSGRAGSGVIRYSNNSVADTITFHVNAGQASVALYQFGGSSFTFNEASTNRYDFTIMYRTA